MVLPAGLEKPKLSTLWKFAASSGSFLKSATDLLVSCSSLSSCLLSLSKTQDANKKSVSYWQHHQAEAIRLFQSPWVLSQDPLA